MAELQVEGADLILRLSAAEKLEGLHGDLRVPLDSVRDIELLEDAHAPVGIRSGVKLGTRIPGIVEVGTIQGRSRRMFAAVHHDTPRGLRVTLAGGTYDEWVVGLQDPAAVLERIGDALRR